jgi:hypothetical protein
MSRTCRAGKLGHSGILGPFFGKLNKLYKRTCRLENKGKKIMFLLYDEIGLDFRSLLKDAISLLFKVLFLN